METPVFNKGTEENECKYLWRVGNAVRAGKITWAEAAARINKEIYGDDLSKYKGESAYRKAYSSARAFQEAGVFSDGAEESLNRLKLEIQKERNKLQTEKSEYNKWIREEARDELIMEKIEQAISEQPYFEIPSPVKINPTHNSYLLCLSDAHYGIEFDIKDLYGKTINAYSPEIFEKRMATLLSKLIYLIELYDIQELNIWELSDSIQGIIRLNSQLMKLRYGVIDSSVRYAYYLAQWLNVLSKYVKIKFQMCIDGNHSQLRLCTDKKDAFPEENMSKVILAIIKLKLERNPNVTIIENETGMAYGLMSCWSVLGYHGEQKNIAKAVDDYSRAYDLHIDYTVCGHKHHSSSEEIGINREAIVVRSIIGVDPYGMHLNKTSNPGASLLCFNQVDGLVCEHKIKL